MANPAPGNPTLSEQLRQGKLLAPGCRSREVLKHVTSQWGLLSLIVLLDGTHRFSELRRTIGGVSEKMLSQSLQCLVQDGLVSRNVLPAVSPHVEYSLTPLGREAALHARALADWIELNLGRIGAVAPSE